MTQVTDLKKECAEKLKSMAPNVSARDRKEAATKVGVHYNTVTKYLKGEITDIEIGANLVSFFKGRIAEKIKKIKRSIAA